MIDALAAAQNIKQIYPDSCVSWALEMVLAMRGIPNIREGHFQHQKKGFGFEPAYLAEMNSHGINTKVVSFADNWMLFANEMTKEVNGGFYPIVTIPSHFYLDLENAGMGMGCHAFIVAPKNGQMTFVTRSYHNQSKVYEISQDDFLRIVRSWITIPASLINRGMILNSLVHS